MDASRQARRAAALAISLAAAAASPGADEAAPAAQPPVTLPDYVVTATRAPQPAGTIAAAVDRLDEEDLRERPALGIDEVLRSSPAFSLFRRSGSLTANPTAQGVSLRGIGPSGASRSLVLFDGVPLNDPFGGWVAWSKIPRLPLVATEIVRGGGSGAWGNGTLSGTVQLLGEREPAAGGALALEAGDFGTRQAEVLARAAAVPGGMLEVGGRLFRTDGFWQYAPGQRGEIDRPLDSRHTLAYANYAKSFRDGGGVRLGLSRFDEHRGNGTPFQRNASRDLTARLEFTRPLPGGLELDLLAYAEREHFRSGFSSVDAARASETPALDQYDVPATAAGAAAVLSRRGDGSWTSFGGDVRRVRGETREDFLFSDGGFQRRRFAGGTQTVGGLFASHTQRLTPALTAEISARADAWSNTDGHRREFVKASGAVVRDETFAARRGAQLSPEAGLVWRPHPDWTVRATGHRAFRLPTLNEYYRPFRVGNVATDANPALALESIVGADLGVTYERRTWRASLGAFANELHDAVANVTLAGTPELTQRQRLNLAGVRVRGLEAGFSWQPAPSLEVAADYLYSDTRVTSAGVAPSLVGRRLAQVPQHAATLRLTWRPAPAWRLSADARATSAQFEDDANELRLAPATALGATLVWTLARDRELHLAVDNLFDASVETGRTADGLVALAPPRLARAGFTARW